MKRLLIPFIALALCPPAQAHHLQPQDELSRSLGLMYYSSKVPNQAATCEYASDVKNYAIGLWDQSALKAAVEMESKFNCN